MNPPQVLGSSAPVAARWRARLALDVVAEAGRSVTRFSHDGPLRVLKTLYPEGPGVCHQVIVHPPGGLVGGDELDIAVHAHAGAHGLVSTPGATRFYRSEGAEATQRVRLTVDHGARLEWVPLETIAFPDCVARNDWAATLAPDGELLAWDVTALGLPAAGQPFVRGRLRQRLSLGNHWLEQATLDAGDRRLLDSPLGLGGHRCLGTLVFARGEALPRERRDALLDALRSPLPAPSDHLRAGATAPHPQLVVLRATAPVVEPLMALFQQAWAALRHTAWGLPDRPPRIWRV